MADFVAALRSGYADIGGLVVDCRPGDFELADGKVVTWRNRAPQMWPGQWTIGQPTQLVPTRRPTPDSSGRVVFSRAAQTWLSAPSLGTQPANSKKLTFGFEIVKGIGTPNHPQVVASSMRATPAVVVERINAADNASFTYGASSEVATGEMADGAHLLGANDAGAGYWSHQNASFTIAGSVADTSFEVPAAVAFAIGHGPDVALNYLDATLSSVRLWRKVLSPHEVDLAWHTLAATGVDYSSLARHPVNYAVWNDGTGDPTLHQGSRLRPLVGAPPYYPLVAMPAAGAARIQVGCEVGGVTLPDAELDGDLFSVSVVERPVGAAPTFEGDAGWSSVFDVLLNQPGHYVLLFRRSRHGGRVVHLDAARP